MAYIFGRYLSVRDCFFRCVQRVRTGRRVDLVKRSVELAVHAMPACRPSAVPFAVGCLVHEIILKLYIRTL